MKKQILPLLLIVFAFASCKKDNHGPASPADEHFPLFAVQQNPEILITNPAGYHVYNGGYGSSMAVFPFGNIHPGLDATRVFYFMTDRGPNVARSEGGNYFPLPSFAPQLGVFKLVKSKLEKLYDIKFSDQHGKLITGLPNPTDQNPTGEIPYDAGGNVLPFDPNGLDPEGLAVDKDGSFWVSDEYGPHIVHFDHFGKTMERISPFQNGTNNREIPKVLINRRPNRGMEGLAITPDGRYLVGAMQSPLDNPGSPSDTRNEARNSRVHRLLLFSIATGTTKQFVYRSEVEGNYISEIIAIGNTEFLVLERDSNFPLPGNSLSSFKRVYKISIAGATDVSGTDNSINGKLFNGKTLEVAAYENDPAFAAVQPVSKALVTDIIQSAPGYPHDKTEGIALIDGHILAVCNDDDFGVIDDGAGNFMPKYLSYFLPNQVIDHGETYFIDLNSNKVVMTTAY